MLFGFVPKLFKIIDIFCPNEIDELPKETLNVFPDNEQDAACELAIVSKHWGIYPATIEISEGTIMSANPEAGTESLSTKVKLRDIGVCRTW